MTNRDGVHLGPIHIVEPIGGHGGMDYYDYGLAYGLGNNGLEVNLYTCDATRVRTYENVSTIITFHNLWNRGFISKISEYIIGHIRAFNKAKKMGGAIVHLHAFTFRFIDLLILLLAKSMSFKIVVTVHDVNSFHLKASKCIEALSYKLIDGVILHNKSSLYALNKKLIFNSPIGIMPHGNYLPFIEPQQSLAISQTPFFRILFFGQIKEVKGLDLLIQSIKLVIDQGYCVHLTIAGRAWKSDTQKYYKLIHDLDLTNHIQVHFRYIPDAEVASFYANSDLVVLPYREIYQSGVLLMTMSYSKPVLCSSLPSFKEIIQHGVNGFLFDSEDVLDLSKQIIEIINGGLELNQKILANADELIRGKYDWNTIGKSTCEFYFSVLNNKI